jgi:hypothetical protein
LAGGPGLARSRPLSESSRICPESFPTGLDLSAETTLRYSDSGTPDSPAKPFGAMQLQVFVAIGDEPTLNADDASYYGGFTRNSVPVVFDEADDGKIATYFALRACHGDAPGPRADLRFSAHNPAVAFAGPPAGVFRWVDVAARRRGRPVSLRRRKVLGTDFSQAAAAFWSGWGKQLDRMSCQVRIPCTRRSAPATGRQLTRCFNSITMASGIDMSGRARIGRRVMI